MVSFDFDAFCGPPALPHHNENYSAACYFGHRPLVELLMSRGAIRNHKNQWGNTRKGFNYLGPPAAAPRAAHLTLPNLQYAALSEAHPKIKDGLETIFQAVDPIQKLSQKLRDIAHHVCDM